MCEGELYVTRSEPRSGAACPFCRGPLWFLQKAVDDVVILTFLSDGKHRSTTSGWNDATFWSLKNSTRAVVDLSRLPTVSGAFVDTIAAIQQRLKSSAGALKICGVNPAVAEVFKDAGLDAVVEIYPDQETALESFEQSGEADSMILPMVSAPIIASETREIAVQA
jgi:anti-anti-sigma regulatory factor